MKLILVISIAVVYASLVSMSPFELTDFACGVRQSKDHSRVARKACGIRIRGTDASEGVAADLYARALAINDGKSWTVLVAADVIDFDPVGCREIKTEARRRFGIRRGVASYWWEVIRTVDLRSLPGALRRVKTSTRSANGRHTSGCSNPGSWSYRRRPPKRGPSIDRSCPRPGKDRNLPACQEDQWHMGVRGGPERTD